MFYLSSLSREICIYPRDLSSLSDSGSIRNIISNKIRELEGQVIGNHGYIISIVEFNQTSRGKIDNETGRVNFKIMYKAITFKLIQGELIDTVPQIINEYGFFCKVGPVQIFVSQHMMPKWSFNKEKNIWNILDSDDSSQNDDEYSDDTHRDNTQSIKIIKMGSQVRIKIIAFRINSNEITGLGSIELSTTF